MKRDFDVVHRQVRSAQHNVNNKMKCPKCESTSYRKNGHRSGKQNYLCKNCRRQFLEPSSSQMQTAEEHSSNGHTKSFLAEATEVSLVKQLPTETEIAKSPNSVTVTTEELLQTFFSDSGWNPLLSGTLSKNFSSLQNHLLNQHRGFLFYF
jgi:ribosomal protein L37AE/L43A